MNACLCVHVCMCVCVCICVFLACVYLYKCVCERERERERVCIQEIPLQSAVLHGVGPAVFRLWMGQHFFRLWMGQQLKSSGYGWATSTSLRERTASFGL